MLDVGCWMLVDLEHQAASEAGVPRCEVGKVEIIQSSDPLKAPKKPLGFMILTLL